MSNQELKDVAALVYLSVGGLGWVGIIAVCWRAYEYLGFLLEVE